MAARSCGRHPCGALAGGGVAVSATQRLPGRRKLVKLLAAVVVGLGIGTMVPPDPVAVPAVGPVSGLLVGAVGVVVGGVLYTKAPASASSCDCDGACDC